jgi:hypothetical protein
LLILGEETTKQDVFEALDFFLLDEYMPDGCLVTACDGLAKDLLNVNALVDASGSIAIQKLLSPHAQRVGRALPVSLRQFASAYFSESASGYLPIVTTKPQQESAPTPTATQEQSENASANGEEQDKPVFSAGETALFVRGKRVGAFTEEETFAFNVVKSQLKLASYSVAVGDEYCTLSIKNNARKTKLSVGRDGGANYQISVTLSAGILDYSKAPTIGDTADAGDVPDGAFYWAEKRLSSQIESAFEKCKNLGCDAFGLGADLQKYHQDKKLFASTLLQNVSPLISVRFQGVR